MARWLIVGDQLRIEANGQLITPTLADVISTFLVDGESQVALAGEEQQTVAQLRFSIYPAALVGVVMVSSGKTIPVVQLSLRPQQGGAVPVSYEVLVSGHAVVNGTWYCVDELSLAELKELLKSAGVDTVGAVRSLGGLLRLKHEANTGTLVEDLLPSGAEATRGLIPQGTEAPAGIQVSLFPYQADGWRWLKFVISEGIGGVLADEMGLGKTIQVISAIIDCGETRLSNTLVVAPGSLLENWRRELTKFAPTLSVLKHNGPTRTGRHAELRRYDVVLVSYDTLVRDLSLFKMVNWDLMILDEAQNIKNPDTLRTKRIKEVPHRAGLAMTGTPLENRLTDLWSIIDFIAPGYLGDLRTFSAQYGNELQGAKAIEPLATPLILRRRVSEVANDLPQRIDVAEVIELSETEALAYEEIRIAFGGQTARAAALRTLNELRRFCAHPDLLNGSASDTPSQFSKFERLKEILAELVIINEKVIVFTSYNAMADMIVRYAYEQHGCFAAALDGRLSIESRQPLIDDFSEVKGAAVLVLNPRAGGSGLNITAATRVIHYNLEWNPALEDQASARAHRRGQTRPVTVHRLFCANTVEDAVNDRLQYKRSVADAAVVGLKGDYEDYIDILAALQRSPLTQGSTHD